MEMFEKKRERILRIFNHLHGYETRMATIRLKKEGQWTTSIRKEVPILEVVRVLSIDRMWVERGVLNDKTQGLSLKKH